MEEKPIVEKTETKPPAAVPWTPRTVFNVCINAPVWLFLKVRNYVFFGFMKAKIFFLFRYANARRWWWDKKWRFKMRLAGYQFITPEQFITMFPPKKNHKPCNEKGYVVRMRPNKVKMIQWCQCVIHKYKESGKKYIVEEPK